MTSKFFFMVAVAAVLTLLVGTAATQTVIQKEEGDDEGYISALPPSQIDNSGTTPDKVLPPDRVSHHEWEPIAASMILSKVFPRDCSAARRQLQPGRPTDSSWYLVGMTPRVSADPLSGLPALPRRFLVFPDLATRPTAE